MHPAASAEAPSDYLEAARAVEEAATSQGGTLAAWSSDSLSVSFAPEDVEAAIGFAVGMSQKPRSLFSVGVAEGELSQASDRGALAGLSWGTALVLAERLSHIARHGEVLLDRDVEALKSGALLSSGRRAGRIGSGVTVKAQRLDVAQPFRRDALAKVGRLVLAPRLVGRAEEISKLDVPLGCVGLVRAARGAGGTRMLRELERRLSPSRVLHIAPGFMPHEPLGALRNAMGRALSKAAPPPLSDELSAALDALLAGDGIPTDTAADLIDAWLGPVEGRSGLLTVDDVGLVDRATLEVVSSAILPRGFFRAVVRTGVDEPLPDALASIPVSSEVSLGPLSIAESEELVRAFCLDAIGDKALRRWARLGRGMPLGIREALAESLGTGELRVVHDVVAPRDRVSGRRKPMGIAEALGSRLGWLSAAERASLTTLAMLGGEAPTEVVDAIATLMEGPAARQVCVAEALLAQGFLAAPEPGWIMLSSRSLSEALLAALDEPTRVLWHRMVARTIERQVASLGLAEPAYHAARAGDGALAASLYSQAARASIGAELVSTARELIARAKEIDPDVAVPELRSEPAPAGLGQTDGLSIMSMIESTIEEVGPKSEDTGLAMPVLRPSAAEVVAALSDDPEADEDPDVMADRLSRLTKQALVEGDLQTLEHLLVRLRVTGEHDDLVERMTAFVLLGRDAHGDALRRLRVAVASADSPRARVRARLAYGIALASVGDVPNALLETLDALARAREAKDHRGEQATSRFLAYLSAAMGQPHAASVWTRAAQGSVDAREARSG